MWNMHEHVVCLWNIYGLMEHCMCLCGTCSDIIYMYIPSMLYAMAIPWRVLWQDLEPLTSTPPTCLFQQCSQLGHILESAPDPIAFQSVESGVASESFPLGSPSICNMTFFGWLKLSKLLEMIDLPLYIRTHNKNDILRTCWDYTNSLLVNGPVRLCWPPKTGNLGKLNSTIQYGLVVNISYGSNMVQIQSTITTRCSKN